MQLRLTLGLTLILGVLCCAADARAQKMLRSGLDLVPGDTLRYTVDGSTPDRTSLFTVYGNSTLYVVGTTTFKARLYRPGYLPSAVQTATVFVAGTVYYTYPDGWALVSLPLTVNNRAKSVVFRSASGYAHAFNSSTGYVREDTLRYGAGYWLKFNGQQAVPISGGLRTTDTVAVQPEWNLVGSISNPIPSTAVGQIPPGIIRSSFYSLSGGYIAVDTLKPGRGYWVRVNSPGKLILSSPATSLQRGVSNPFSVVNGAATISISDLSGAKQTLCLTSELLEQKQLDLFDLPPPPPNGIFDARFATDRMLETVQRGKMSEIPIRMSSEQYPVVIAWKLNSHSLGASLVIGSKELPIRGDGSMTISSRPAQLVLKVTVEGSIPREFVVFQNYPNPFNPLTTIKYELPADSRVSLKVFNILGQEVATLVNEVQKAGYKSVEWNASGNASGVYFYRLDAGSFASVKKMLLLR